MAANKTLKMILLIGLLLGTATAWYAMDSRATVFATPSTTLDACFTSVPGWQYRASHELPHNIVDALELDDHLFRSFGPAADPVTLYVGYYHTAAKVGAAHDPLVCFQGQGWSIIDRNKGTLSLHGPSGHTVSYATMLTEREGQQELLLYWFQAGDTTTATTLAQKLTMIRHKLTGGTPNNAFVRLSTTVRNGDVQGAKQRMLDFVEQFYPQFYTYVTER